MSLQYWCPIVRLSCGTASEIQLAQTLGAEPVERNRVVHKNLSEFHTTLVAVSTETPPVSQWLTHNLHTHAHTHPHLERQLEGEILLSAEAAGHMADVADGQLQFLAKLRYQ